MTDAVIEVSRQILVELRKLLRSPAYIGCVGLALLLAIFSGVLGILGAEEWLTLKGIGGDEWIVLSIQGSYCRSLFLSQDLAAEVFFLLLPTLASASVSLSWSWELRSGYLAQGLTRARRGRYVCAKAFVVFLGGLIVAVSAELVNYALVSCALPAYAPEPLDSLYIGFATGDELSRLLFLSPVAFVLVRIAISGIVCGTWALLLMAFAPRECSGGMLAAFSLLSCVSLKYLNDVVFRAFRVQGFSFNVLDLSRGAPLYPTVLFVHACIFIAALALSCVLLARKSGSDVL